MIRSWVLIGLLLISGCGKPADMVGLPGPVPRSSDWPFGEQNHVVFRASENDKAANLHELDITNASPVPRFRQNNIDGSFSTGEIWFHINAQSQRVGIARRYLAHSADGKTTETFKETEVNYALFDVIPNQTPMRIKLSIATCPYTAYDEKKPDAELRPLHACEAKNAELTWALINQHPDMLAYPQMLELVSPQ